MTAFAGCRGAERKFFVQARPFEPHAIAFLDETRRWPALRDARGVTIPFVLSMDMPLHFCPFCGTDLDRWIVENPTRFDEMVRPDLRS
jgi:hypothetical protein